MDSSDALQTASFFKKAIRDIAKLSEPSKVKLLDFGCGDGDLVKELRVQGYDAYGCDIIPTNSPFLKTISSEQYCLPFEDCTFDIVVSTSVFEHVQNKAEAFSEIARCLKPGGYSMHLIPSKWYLPYEPHIFVPFVNIMWPHVPGWWFTLWAWLGVRNQFQKSKHWKEVRDLNIAYCANCLSYWPTHRYRKLAIRVFGNYRERMDFYVQESHGGAAALARTLPMRSLWAFLLGKTRMIFVIHVKA